MQPPAAASSVKGFRFGPVNANTRRLDGADDQSPSSATKGICFSRSASRRDS